MSDLTWKGIDRFIIRKSGVFFGGVQLALACFAFVVVNYMEISTTSTLLTALPPGMNCIFSAWGDLLPSDC